MNRLISWRIEGPFDSTYSLALLNREIARALEHIGVNVALHSTEGGGDFEPSREYLKANPDLNRMHSREGQIRAEDADVTSRNLYPPRVADMCSKVNLLHSYAWEETGFPRNWVNSFNMHLSGLSCLSAHVMKVMLDNGVCVPMTVTGCGVDHWERVRSNSNYKLGIEFRDRFKFLHVSSFFPRKGPDSLLDAYGRAFSCADDVVLVIKTFPNPHNDIHNLLKKYRTTYPSYPQVLIIESDLTDADLKSLYEQCDVLVAPSCAEGFGLPLAEAMLSGLPVITTAWSGQMDFCNPENSWLVDYSFEQADTHFNIIPSAWASIDRSLLASAMKDASATSKAQLELMAEKGRTLLLDKFTWKGVAQRLVQFRSTLVKEKRAEGIKLGWISTWNVKCGIATYSEHLLQSFNLSPYIFASKDNNVLNVDDDITFRCWASDDRDDLKELASEINSNSINVLVIQFNFGFFSHESFYKFVLDQKQKGTILVVDLHATVDPPQAPHKRMKNYAAGLELCDRILVHSIADMNRMKEFVSVDRLVLFPHGILDVSEPAITKKRAHTYQIATYGFCLPHKGLTEVIEAVQILRHDGVDVGLNMINAEYPIDFSKSLVNEIRSLIDEYNLQDSVNLISTFLPDGESLEYLQQADLVIFAYHPTSESASGAVRYGLAAGRPTLVTDIPIFEELGASVWRVSDHSPAALASRINEVLQAIEQMTNDELIRASAAKAWREQHRYPELSRRLENMITSLYVNA